MTQLNVTGMTCGHCQGAVKSALEAVSGVKSVEVDLDSGLAKVAGEAEVQQLLDAIEEAGYQASLATD